MLRAGILLLLSATVPIAYSESVQIEVWDKSTFTYYHEKTYDPRFYQKGYINLRLRDAVNYADQNGFTGSFREYYIRQTYQNARQEILGSSWRGSAAEAFLKAGVNKASGAAVGAVLGTPSPVGPIGGAFLGGVAGEAGSRAISWGFDQLGSLPTRGYPAPSATVEGNVWGDNQKQSGDPVLKEIEEELDKDVEQRKGNVPYSQDKDVVARNRHDETNENVLLEGSRLRQKITQDGKITRQELKEYQEYTAEVAKTLNNQMLDSVEYLRNLNKIQLIRLQEEQQAKEEQILKSNMSGPFVFASHLAHLFKDEEAAQKFDKTAQLASTICDLSNGIKALEKNPDLFSKAPFQYINLYMAAASLAMDILSSSQKSEGQMIMESLQRIAQQIEELRKEMHQRFDRLEMQSYMYFIATKLDLNDIKRTQANLQNDVQQVIEAMNRIEAKMNRGFNALGDMQISQIEAKCFGQDFDGSPKTLDGKDKANECLSFYMLLGAGRFTDAVRITRQNSPIATQTQVEEFKDLVEQVQWARGPRLISVYPPEQFAFGAHRLLSLLQLNPSHVGLAKTGRWLSNYPVMEELRAHGQSLRDFIKGMAVEVSGNGYHIRKALFDQVLQNYRRAAFRAIEHAQSLIDETRGRGPVPGRQNTDEADRDIEKGSFPLYNVNIDMCPNAQRVRGSYNIYNFTRDIDERIGRTYGYDPKVVHLNSKFYEYLPKSVRWALRMQGAGDGLLQAQPTVCFSKFNVHDINVHFGGGGWVVQIDRTRLDLELQVEIGMKYVRYDENGKPIEEFTPITRLYGRRAEWFGPFEPNQGSYVLNHAWDGHPFSSGTRLFINAKERTFGIAIISKEITFGIAQDPQSFFQAVALNEQEKAQYRKFEEAFAKILERRRSMALSLLEQRPAGSSGQTETSTWQLNYLVQNGLDLSHPKALELNNMIHLPGLPQTNDIIYSMISKGLSGKEAMEAVDKAVAPFQEKINELDKLDDLAPAPNPLDLYVNMLDLYQSDGLGNSKGLLERFKSWISGKP